jgi:hypothetical protein
MTVRNRPSQRHPASEHIVQFFDTDESRAQAAAAFVAEGAVEAEPVLVIARSLTWSTMIAPLASLGVNVQDALAAGRLVVRDAHDLLRRLTRNGAPDAALFEEMLGKPLKALAARGARVRAYGEMVDILAQRDDLDEAVAVERLWNGLTARLPMTVLCGYSAAHFVSSNTHRALLEICGAHTGVHSHAQDPLAAWLLATAHNGPAAPASLY